jgi:hypothetical protein
LRNGRAGFGFGVVVGVGIDVLGVDDTIRVRNEFDAGDVNTISGEEGVLALFQSRVDVVDNGEFGARLFSYWTEGVADGTDVGN